MVQCTCTYRYNMSYCLYRYIIVQSRIAPGCKVNEVLRLRTLAVVPEAARPVSLFSIISSSCFTSIFFLLLFFLQVAKENIRATATGSGNLLILGFTVGHSGCGTVTGHTMLVATSSTNHLMLCSTITQ